MNNESISIIDRFRANVLAMDDIILREIIWKGKSKSWDFDESNYMNIILIMIDELRDDINK